MSEELRSLFHELSDLSGPQREEYYVRRDIAPDLRSELEALLAFDAEPRDPITEVVGSAAEDFLTTNAPARQKSRRRTRTAKERPARSKRR